MLIIESVSLKQILDLKSRGFQVVLGSQPRPENCKYTVLKTDR